MKRKVLFFFATMLMNICMAQSVKTNSVYDTDQNGDVNIADVTAVVEKVKTNTSAASTQQYVTADSLSNLFISLKREISTLKGDLKLVKKKLGIDDSDTIFYVDLGLPSGTLWATCNVGATSSDDYGQYFAWGETTGYTQMHNFNWENYTLSKEGTEELTKYCIIDFKTELDSIDDAATINWGCEWQMPTKDQLEELFSSSYTTTSWTTRNGISGKLITSNMPGHTNKSIFLPAGGYYDGTTHVYGDNTYGLYWCRTRAWDFSTRAYVISFNKYDTENFDMERYKGLCVRPVRVKQETK